MKSRIVDGDVEFELEKRELAALRDAAAVLDMLNRLKPAEKIGQAITTLREVVQALSPSAALPGQKTLPLQE